VAAGLLGNGFNHQAVIQGNDGVGRDLIHRNDHPWPKQIALTEPRWAANDPTGCRLKAKVLTRVHALIRPHKQGALGLELWLSAAYGGSATEP